MKATLPKQKQPCKQHRALHGTAGFQNKSRQSFLKMVRCTQDAAAAVESSAPQNGTGDDGRKLALYQTDLATDIKLTKEVVIKAIKSGEIRQEIDVPYIEEMLPDSFRTADQIFRANVGVAIKLAQALTEDGYRVRLLNPDDFELKNALEQGRRVAELSDGYISLGHTRENRKGIFLGISTIMAGKAEQLPEGAQKADIFLAVNHQSSDLGPLQTYCEEVAKDRTVIIFNSQLNEVRTKFGIIGFPPKSLHTEFLSFFKPVLFRQEIEYTQSVRTKEGKIEVVGCMYREFPGPWQLFTLDADAQQYTEAECSDDRYRVSEIYTRLRDAMGIKKENLRREFSLAGEQIEWYEDDLLSERSSNWRR